MLIKFSAVLIPGARVAQASVSTSLTVATVADVLRTGGLEIATPLAMADRLGACGIAPGDRLAIYAAAPRPGDFPSPVRTGGREITVRAGDIDVSSSGRTTLTIGVTDPSDPPAPDVDLRHSAHSSRVNLLPSRCATLLFDGQIGQWFAALTGGARVLIDDYELTQQPIPISGTHTLRFYTPLDDPATHPPLADVRLTVTTTRAEPDVPRLPVGPLPLSVCFGMALGPYTLRASDNVRVGQVASGLARQSDVELAETAYVTRLRLAPPGIQVSDLLPGEMLYAGSG